MACARITPLPGAAAAAVVALLALTGLAPATPAAALTSPDLVATVPATTTPSVLDNGSGTAEVLAIAKVGSRIVIGGTFSSIADPAGIPTAANNLAVFDAATGEVTALPTVDGAVQALAKGSKKGTVWVGGSFNTVNGKARPKLALIDVKTGQLVKSFAPPILDAKVTDLVRVPGHLIVGGKFRTADGNKQHALISLDKKTGANDRWIKLSFTGHHNWIKGTDNRAQAPRGITAMAVDSERTRLVVVGNFTKVDGLTREQVAVIDLTRRHPGLWRTWATESFASECNYRRFDSWVRDVVVGANDSYFVVASTGGGYGGTLCDSAARLELKTRSRTVTPTWVSWTGGDTLDSVAADDRAIYIGGHMRWVNNSYGRDEAQAGAVPRPSIAALDPETGLPWSWNPGRHPRGVGVQALLVTGEGLYVGSDTDYLGKAEYLRPRIALLPRVGGQALPAMAPPPNPDVYRAGTPDLGTGQLERLHLGPNGVDQTWPIPLDSDVPWGSVRGAFTVDDDLWLTMANGDLIKRPFDGEAVGAPTTVEPWNDPFWSDQQTGSRGNQTYKGKQSPLGSALANVRALTYSDGLLFYTNYGSTALNVRGFNPESGVVADRGSIVPDVVVPMSTTGLFVKGTSMYLADADGTLTRRSLQGRALASTGSVVSGPGIDGTNWADAVLFAGVGPAAG